MENRYQNPVHEKCCRRLLRVLRLEVGVRNAANESGYMRTRECPTERPLYPSTIPNDHTNPYCAKCQRRICSDARTMHSLAGPIPQTQQEVVKFVAHNKTSLVTCSGVKSKTFNKTFKAAESDWQREQKRFIVQQRLPCPHS
jgi:hypothetical protein